MLPEYFNTNDVNFAKNEIVQGSVQYFATMWLPVTSKSNGSHSPKLLIGASVDISG